MQISPKSLSLTVYILLGNLQERKVWEKEISAQDDENRKKKMCPFDQNYYF